MSISKRDYYPRRIVCLTEETTETLYHLGEEARIVGISGFTMRPPQARKEKPKVSTFLDANVGEIVKLKPDLVIGFSDIQASIAEALVKEGITVWINNHRSVAEILSMMVQLGALVGKTDKAMELVEDIESEIKRIKTITSQWEVKPRVYFEEWFDPLITGIKWVSELVEIAGGEDVFIDHSQESLAKNRILKDPSIVIDKNPDIILASWCGKMVKKKKIRQRPGWDTIKAIKNDDLYELKSEIILQPGPASVTEGLSQLHQIFANWVLKNGETKNIS